MSFANYTPEQVQAARVYAASIPQNLIDSLRSGETKCRDPQTWILELEDSIEEILDGRADGNFTVWQRMHYALSGECVALLSK